MFIIRSYQPEDALALRHLFFNTIRNVNIKDYSQSQVEAWAPKEYSLETWSERISGINPFVATLKDKIVGYADVQNNGYIDHFYCHYNYQGKGIGKILMNKLIETGIENNVIQFYSHVSITAKPFFEHFGFKVVKKQSVDTGGVMLVNYVMEKII